MELPPPRRWPGANRAGRLATIVCTTMRGQGSSHEFSPSKMMDLDQGHSVLLEVKGLRKSFGGIRAVEGASFGVEAGTVTSLIGPNGAGKTTVFNLINGILRADAGSVWFDGEQVTGRMPHLLTRRGIGRTFQITRALGQMTVLENMIVGSPATGWRAAIGSRMLDHEIERAMELLAFVGIAKLAHARANTLSYGQHKLLEFASVLMSEPRLVMLDEPAGGVNPALLEQIVERIRLLNDGGVTFLIVEHNMNMVMSLSDAVVVMAHGEVLTQGSPEDVQRDGRVLDAYLGRA